MNPLKFMCLGLVQFYRWFISPLKTVLFGPMGRCRYTPSCSGYALEAIRRHGAIRGTWLATCRLGRCHPWAPHGHDPVPEKETGNSRSNTRGVELLPGGTHSSHSREFN